jgi:hypothetical protein
MLIMTRAGVGVVAAIAAVVGVLLYLFVSHVDNGYPPDRGVTGGHVVNTCAGTGLGIVTSSSPEPGEVLHCRSWRDWQESVTAAVPFVVEIQGGQPVCHPAGAHVRLNPEAHSPAPSFNVYTVGSCA